MSLEMNVETILALVCSILLCVYLVYALLRPEKF
jgi:K+-transporting ATPase KdpF subunit